VHGATLAFKAEVTGVGGGWRRKWATATWRHGCARGVGGWGALRSATAGLGRGSGPNEASRGRNGVAGSKRRIGRGRPWLPAATWRGARGGRTRRPGALAWSTRGLAARYGELAGWVG
jgi:hypothetical protein